MAAGALITISCPRSTNGAPPSLYDILANMKQSRHKKWNRRMKSQNATVEELMVILVF